ncbi:hypothetical protein KPSA1_05792 [Pseudomonas syringae pv. actinidiae]|nr:hypothetical protein KPSA1_05792 [Pseudomonas syringae pv. actinidiae]
MFLVHWLKAATQVKLCSARSVSEQAHGEKFLRRMLHKSIHQNLSKALAS